MGLGGVGLDWIELEFDGAGLNQAGLDRVGLG